MMHNGRLSTAVGKDVFRRLRNPHDVQVFLNKIPYDAEPGTSSPGIVASERKANCFEGALFAAAALRCLGYKPLIVDMIAENDDDHVFALFKRGGHYGAVAKSNTTMLRYREPVYRSLRELVMSYFDFYFNIKGQKSLRSYSNPVDLSRFDKRNWMTTDENLDYIGDYLNEVKHHLVLGGQMIRKLSYADDDLVGLCFNGAVKDGVYRPK
ncbi:MAG: hypothetical protein M1378_05535 [Bacteroidetes bacterium]|nr:hypothetical protein [Bacteroidota bacterium]MCL5034387.1 hypothetical protein [Bacteroidota bacterium]